MKKLTKHAKKELNNECDIADARRSYRQAIDTFERYRKEYEFDEQYLYKLGVLYDHLYLFKTSKIKNHQKRNRLAKLYLNKAKQLYREVVSQNPHNLFGYRGLARVAEARNKHQEAIRYAKKAFSIWKTIPRKQKGALGIGTFFESAGQIKDAEKWYRRELSVLGEKDIGAVANLMRFYQRTKKIDEALPLANKLERILFDMFGVSGPEELKPIARNNKTIRVLLDSIADIRKPIR